MKRCRLEIIVFDSFSAKVRLSNDSIYFNPNFFFFDQPDDESSILYNGTSPYYATNSRGDCGFWY